MTWQPIETAPRDGTEVLLFGQRGDKIDIGSWCGCGVYRRETKERPAFFEQAWGDGANMYWPIPTHWMPLPEPPEPLSRARTAEVE